MSTHEVVDRCDFQSGQMVNNLYTVRKSLGDGSFGVVYLVDDNRRHQYAMKLLRLWEVPSEIRQPLKDRFKMEFETGQIACDNLVQSVDYGFVGGNPFIVMEYCPGGDLEPMLGRSDAPAVRICRDILRGLNALHNHGKVHRDLKPENVLFKQNGMAALTDFGIAGDRTHRMTQRNIFGKPNQIFGTYAYMPPEQVNRARGGATVLPTTDIFSFGVLAYQLLTGYLPFGKLESHNELAEYQINGKNGTWNRALLHRHPQGGQWLPLIEGCLKPDFRERLQTVSDVMRRLPNDITVSQQPYALSQVYQPSRQTRGFLLRVMQGEEHGRTYDLSLLSARLNTRLLTMGRQPDNAVFIKSAYSDYLSRYHCTIEIADGGQWAIRDGQWQKQQRQWRLSRNGTFVNSHPVTQSGYYLKPGDMIAVGDVTLRFENY